MKDSAREDPHALTYRGIPLVVEEHMGTEIVVSDPHMKELEDMVAAMRFDPLSPSDLSILTITDRFGTRSIQKYIDQLEAEVMNTPTHSDQETTK